MEFFWKLGAMILIIAAAYFAGIEEWDKAQTLVLMAIYAAVRLVAEQGTAHP